MNEDINREISLLRTLLSISIGGLVCSIGIGIAITCFLMAHNEGINWEWWQILVVSISGIGGIGLVTPFAIYVSIWFMEN